MAGNVSLRVHSFNSRFNFCQETIPRAIDSWTKVLNIPHLDGESLCGFPQFLKEIFTHLCFHIFIPFYPSQFTLNSTGRLPSSLLFPSERNWHFHEGREKGLSQIMASKVYQYQLYILSRSVLWALCFIQHTFFYSRKFSFSTETNQKSLFVSSFQSESCKVEPTRTRLSNPHKWSSRIVIGKYKISNVNVSNSNVKSDFPPLKRTLDAVLQWMEWGLRSGFNLFTISRSRNFSWH